MVGKRSARHMAYVQFNLIIFGRRASHGIAAPSAVLEDEFKVLPSVIPEWVGCGQLQLQDHDIMGGRLYLHHARRHLANLNIAGHADLARFNLHVRTGLRLAEQGIARSQILGRQNLRRMRTGLVFAGHHAALAGGTRPIVTTVGQDDAGRQRCIQHSLTGLYRKLMPAGRNGNLKTHSDSKRVRSGCLTLTDKSLPLRARFPIYWANSAPSSTT